MASSNLIVHVGGVRRTREELQGLETPPRTDTWTPVPHYDLVSSLIDGLQTHGIVVAKEEYATSHGDARIFGVLDLIIPDLPALPDYGMALGIRGSNDKSMAIQATAGARVFVCDNMAFSGDSGTVVLRKKHTSRLDLRAVVPPAIDKYLDNAGAFVLDIERMKGLELTDARAKEVIFDAFDANPILPRALFPVIADLYFRDDEQREKFPERTAWAINNAFTEAVKRLKPEPQSRGAIAIGRYFGKAFRQQGARSAAVAALAAPIFDAVDPMLEIPGAIEVIEH